VAGLLRGLAGPEVHQVVEGVREVVGGVGDPVTGQPPVVGESLQLGHARLVDDHADQLFQRERRPVHACADVVVRPLFCHGVPRPSSPTCSS
jgi:hypothetical protein